MQRFLASRITTSIANISFALAMNDFRYDWAGTSTNFDEELNFSCLLCRDMTDCDVKSECYFIRHCRKEYLNRARLDWSFTGM